MNYNDKTATFLKNKFYELYNSKVFQKSFPQAVENCVEK